MKFFSFLIIFGVLLVGVLGLNFMFSGVSGAYSAPAGSWYSTYPTDIGCAYGCPPNEFGLTRPPDLVVVHDWSAVNPCFYYSLEEGGFSDEMFKADLGKLQKMFLPAMAPPQSPDAYFNKERVIYFYLKEGYIMPQHLRDLPKPIVCEIVPERDSIFKD